MTIKFYDIASGPIEFIKEWFEDYFGFRPTTSQAVEFAINTIEHIPKKDFKATYAKSIRLGLKGRSVKVSERTKVKVQKFREHYRSLMYLDEGMVVAVMLQHRSFHLPVKGRSWASMAYMKSTKAPKSLTSLDRHLNKAILIN